MARRIGGMSSLAEPRRVGGSATASIPFTKMHGLGNDFIVVDAVADATLAECSDWHVDVPRMCARPTGVGADGVLIVSRDREGGRNDFVMHVINADGSEPEMCGNGLRCAARLVVERGYANDKPVQFTTAGVVRSAKVAHGDDGLWCTTVDMGVPGIGVDAVGGRAMLLTPISDNQFGLKCASGDVVVTLVSIGNPHAIVFLEGVGQRDLLSEGTLIRMGAAIAQHDAFPNGINVQFVGVRSAEEIDLRIWERGVGVTTACGSGACAAAVACVKVQKSSRRVTVHMLGGDLQIEWRRGDEHVLMTGPAERVFDGVWRRESQWQRRRH